MGYSTLIHLQNDHIHKVFTDPEGWITAMREFVSGGYRIHEPKLIQHPGHGRVLRMAHDDDCTLHAVGGCAPGGGAELLNLHYGQLREAPDRAIEMCRLWADSLGFRLVKKPEKKSD